MRGTYIQHVCMYGIDQEKKTEWLWWHVHHAFKSIVVKRTYFFISEQPSFFNSHIYYVCDEKGNKPEKKSISLFFPPVNNSIKLTTLSRLFCIRWVILMSWISVSDLFPVSRLHVQLHQSLQVPHLGISLWGIAMVSQPLKVHRTLRQRFTLSLV